MLNRLISRTIFSRCTFSLTRPTYVLPEEVNWLDQQFHNDPRFSQMFSYLKSLEVLNRLPSFYQNKTFDTLSQAQIFFLMNSSKIPCILNRKRQENFVAKVQSTYFKCLLYKQFALLGRVEQMIIILSFNQQIFQLKPFEIAFCLGVMSDFQFSNEIDLDNLTKILKQYDSTDHYHHQMIVIHGYLADMEIVIKDTLTPQNLERWVKNNQKLGLREIYFIYKLHEVLGIELEPQVKEKLDHHIHKAIDNSKFRQFEANFLVFLVKYYPEQRQKLSQLHFTPKAYLNYLRFYAKSQELKIDPHPIPSSVVQLSNRPTYQSIFELRMLLGLDTPASAAKEVANHFTYELQPVITLVKHLMGHKIREPEIEYYIQKACLAKLHMTDFDPKILEQYSISNVITILAILSHMKYCSVHFWRTAVRWLQKLIDYQKDDSSIIKQYKKVIMNLLDLALQKNFKEETRQYLYEEMISFLERKDEHFQILTLKRLVSTLTKARVGQPKIWLLIQYRLSEIIANNVSQSDDQKCLYQLASAFNSMNKGSPALWAAINTHLSLHYKKQLLSKSRHPLNPITLYITVPNEEE